MDMIPPPIFRPITEIQATETIPDNYYQKSSVAMMQAKRYQDYLSTKKTILQLNTPSKAVLDSIKQANTPTRKWLMEMKRLNKNSIKYDSNGLPQHRFVIRYNSKAELPDDISAQLNTKSRNLVYKIISQILTAEGRYKHIHYQDLPKK